MKIVLLLLLALVQSKKLSQQQVVFAIDCGSTQNTQTGDSILYSEDQFYNDFTQISNYLQDTRIMDKKIKFTRDPTIYLTERHAKKSDITYNLPGKLSAGSYTIILKFAELWFTQQGERVFDIYIGNTLIIEDFDILAKTEPLAAYDEYIEVKLSEEGVLTYKNKIISQGYHNSILTISLKKGQADFPKIDGLVMISGGIKDSDYQERQRLVKNWEQIITQGNGKPTIKVERVEVEQSGMDSDDQFWIYFMIVGLLVSGIIIIQGLDKQDKKKN